MENRTGVEIAPQRLGHLNIFVSDYEKSGQFYSNVCGFKEVFREPGISMIFMSNGNTHHDLGLMEITTGIRTGKDGYVQVAAGNGRTPGLNHLGFEMRTEQQLVDAYRRAKSKNVPINRTTDHQIAHSLYLSELNGHTLEFYADVVEDWRGVYANNTGKLISGHWDPEAKVPLQEQQGVYTGELYRSEESILPARNVAYAALPVNNLEASIDYYVDVLGLDLKYKNDEIKFAIMSGKAESGCDVFLMEMSQFPAVRMLFGGVQMHRGQPIRQGLEWLKKKGVPASLVGDDQDGALVVMDPDGIPLVYSTAPALELMKQHGPAVVDEVQKLSRMSAVG
jgi:catechol 2,3-dioxygenase